MRACNKEHWRAPGAHSEHTCARAFFCADGEHAYAPTRNTLATTVNTPVRQQGTLARADSEHTSACAPTVGTRSRQQGASILQASTFVRRRWTRVYAKKEHLCASTGNTHVRRQRALFCADGEHAYAPTRSTLVLVRQQGHLCAPTVHTLVRRQRALYAPTVNTLMRQRGTLLHRRCTNLRAKKEHSCAPTVGTPLRQQ